MLSLDRQGEVMELTTEELTLACECVSDIIDTIEKQWETTGFPPELKDKFLKQYRSLFHKLFGELSRRIVNN
jgi:hypothetical protein